jgi:hypothetical protein
LGIWLAWFVGAMARRNRLADMDDQDEIIDRLARLDHKLDYLTSIALCVLGMAFGAIVYFFFERAGG